MKILEFFFEYNGLTEKIKKIVKRAEKSNNVLFADGGNKDLIGCTETGGWNIQSSSGKIYARLVEANAQTEEGANWRRQFVLPSDEKNLSIDQFFKSVFFSTEGYNCENGCYLLMSIEELAKEFILDCKVRNLSPRTVRNYEKQLAYFTRFLKESQHLLNILKRDGETINISPSFLRILIHL